MCVCVWVCVCVCLCVCLCVSVCVSVCVCSSSTPHFTQPHHHPHHHRRGRDDGRCMLKEPDLRPAARHLLHHAWITSIHDGHMSEFRVWIADIDKRLHRTHPHMVQP